MSKIGKLSLLLGMATGVIIGFFRPSKGEDLRGNITKKQVARGLEHKVVSKKMSETADDVDGREEALPCSEASKLIDPFRLREDSKKDKKWLEIEDIINDVGDVIPFLKEDNISPFKFLINYKTLLLPNDYVGMAIIPSSPYYLPDVSPSLIYFLEHPFHTPLATWWPAAYPDVAVWMQENENMVKNGMQKFEPQRDEQSMIYPRALVELYKEETGKKLECSE